MVMWWWYMQQRIGYSSVKDSQWVAEDDILQNLLRLSQILQAYMEEAMLMLVDSGRWWQKLDLSLDRESLKGIGYQKSRMFVGFGAGAAESLLGRRTLCPCWKAGWGDAWTLRESSMILFFIFEVYNLRTMSFNSALANVNRSLLESFVLLQSEPLL